MHRLIRIGSLPWIKHIKSQGYPVIAISSINPENETRDSYENMIVRAKEKGYTFPYLFDANQKVLVKFGAQYTPTSFVLHKNSQGELIVKYIGAIDDNYQNPSSVIVHYVEDALDALLLGKNP